MTTTERKAWFIAKIAECRQLIRDGETTPALGSHVSKGRHTSSTRQQRTINACLGGLRDIGEG